MVENDNIYRPIQYLGCKSKLLNSIMETASAHLNEGKTAVDLFSGTAVVSQAFSKRTKVIGIDSAKFSKSIFEATVNRPEFEFNAESYENEVFEPSENEKKEEKYISNNEFAKLISFYKKNNKEFNENYEPSNKWWMENTENGERWIEAIYGGHFFSFKQARILSEFRKKNNEEHNKPAYLCALLSAASNMSCSAGKHFAAPLNFLGEETTHFVQKRLMQDRKKDAKKYFLDSLERLRQLKKTSYGGTSKYITAVLPKIPELDEPISLFYADPPYTTDQYSRYYHVLETLTTNKKFYLELSRNRTPYLGRYPEARKNSDFSSTKKATAAFETLFKNISKYSTPFILSYSTPKANSRCRTLEIKEIRELLESNFKTVGETITLKHGYKPLQPKNKKAESSHEVLVVAK